MNIQYYRYKVENLLVIGKIVTIHYYEFHKNFVGAEESHDFWELVYVEKGEAVCRINGEDIPMKEGEVLFHQPNVLHSVHGDGEHALNLFIASFECKSEAMRFFGNRKFTLDNKLIACIYPIINEAQNTFEPIVYDPTMQKIKMKMVPLPSLGGLQIIKNYLEILLISIMQKESERNTSNVAFVPPEQFDEFISSQVIAYMREHLYDELKIEDICAQLHYTKSYIFRQFKKATGISIMAYFTEMKIKQAKILLRESELSIRDLAARLSFDSPNYFSKVFKKITGYTPSTYRKIKKVHK